MKKANTLFAMALLVMAGCMGCTKQSGKSSDELITIDVTAKYPKKEFILQDILDVEYIPLETTDEFVCQGVPLAIGEEIILIRNIQSEIFIFDRNGKGIRKIDRRGESAEEYLYNYNAFLDEKNGEIFICDRKTLVYDLYGNFKRSFEQKKDASLDDVTNFNEEGFIWWNAAFNFNAESVDMPSFFITSKLDGTILKEIEIPFEGRKSPIIIWTEGEMTYASGPHNKSIIPFKNEMILTEASSDTVYRYTQDHRLIPLLARTPSLQSMDPEVFLLPGVITDDYIFMDINTKQKDSKDVSIVHDRQTGETFQYTVFNDDYSSKERVNMYSMGKNGNPNIAFCQALNIDRLLEAYEKGQLKGRLKEIAAGLEEDANAVIMLGKYKKQ